MAGRLFAQKNLELKEFPNLFQMEGHTGGFGFAFSLTWFGLIAIFTPTVVPPMLAGSAAFVAGAFGLLVWASFWLGDHFAARILELNDIHSEQEKIDQKSRLEDRVRTWIAVLSGSYVFVCCVLIWLTGGLLSPFTPFYIMIFTLTIDKCEVPNPGASVLLFFAAMISLTFTIYAVWTPPIALNMDEILHSSVHKGMHVFFVLASLAVPVVSKGLLARKKEREKRKKERLSASTSAANTANITDVPADADALTGPGAGKTP